jgi:hypothetical protein
MGWRYGLIGVERGGGGWGGFVRIANFCRKFDEGCQSWPQKKLARSSQYFRILCGFCRVVLLYMCTCIWKTRGVGERSRRGRKPFFFLIIRRSLATRLIQSSTHTVEWCQLNVPTLAVRSDMSLCVRCVSTNLNLSCCMRLVAHPLANAQFTEITTLSL